MDTKHRAQALRTAIAELRTTIAERAGEVEAARRLPIDLLDQLKAAGLFRMFVPRSHGGHEIELIDGLAVIEELARIDGATAWTVMIGAQTPHLLAMLPASKFDRIYAAGPDVVAAGAMAPHGRARPDGGGYVVDGRWSFATGCQHSDWLYGNCVIADERGRSRGTAGDAPPTLRTMVFPARDGRIIEHWNVLGMRGSGSHDIAVEELFVPEAYAFDAMACTPCVPSPHFVEPPLHIHLQLAAVAVGIAMGSVDDLIAIAASGKKRLYAKEALSASPRFHHQVGNVLAEVRAARAWLRDLAARFWALCLEDRPAAKAMTGEILGATSWVVHAASDVVTACYRAAGSGAIRDGAILQRRFRDAHVLTQHIAATDGWITQMGAGALGAAVHVG